MKRFSCLLLAFCCGLASASLPGGSLDRLDYTGLLNRWGRVLDGCGYTEDPLGLRTNVTRNLGLTTNPLAVGYDSIGQLVSWSGKETGGALRQNEQFAFGYDRAHNLNSRTSGALIQTFNTDVANQLTNITRSGALTVSGVTTVPAASVTVNGQAAQTNADFTFASTNNTLTNGQNSFTIVARNANGLATTNIVSVNLPSSAALQYDLDGNLTSDGTRSFAYDAEDRLATNWVAGAWKSEFVYDGLGRRRIARDYGWQGGQWVKTNETRYLYDRLLVLQERDSNNVVQVTYTRGLDLSGTLQYAGGIGGLLARTDASGSAFYHSDGAGNVTGLIDANENMAARYLYGPFGRVTAQWGPLAAVNAMQSSSMPKHSQSGIVGYPFRFYDPTLQRFLSRDPIGEAGGINLYGFVGNNPLNFVDPYGLAWYDYIPGIGPGIAQARGTSALNAMLSANGYNGIGDFQQQHPGFGGNIVSGNPDAVAAAANLAGGATRAYLDAVQQLAMGGIVTKAASEAASEIGDAGDSWGNKLSNLLRKRCPKKKLPTLEISASKYPDLAQNIANAQLAGHSDLLTYGGDAAANRAAALQDVPRIPGLSRDEYPFASSMEGEEGAWVGHIPGPQQSAQGALIKNFVEQNNIQAGDQFQVRVVP
jgi:RHS repeat-associated protein